MSQGQNQTFICEAKRTPIGAFQGALSKLSAPQLASAVLAEVLTTSALPGDAVDEVILGCVLQAGVGQAPARQAMLGAGIPESTQAMTINKVCSSGLKAVMLAAQAIELGHASVIMAGGMESMSQAPYLMPTLRVGARAGHVQAIDSILSDGLLDPYSNNHMGHCAELCAQKFNFSREAQDEFAELSYRRANAAIDKRYFRDEIVSITLTDKASTSVIAEDEEPRRVKYDKIKSLKPAFREGGSVTVANASSLSDGAAVLLVCSEQAVKRFSLKPLARVVAYGAFGTKPEEFTTAPIGATKQVLAKAGHKVADIDLFEINEAFAVVALACRQELKIPEEKLNICGGSVALGHPIGASGGRILVTLLHSLKRTGGKLGLAAICNGGGEATSILVERI